MCSAGNIPMSMGYMGPMEPYRYNDGPTGPTGPTDLGVCANQNVFNKALYRAIKHNIREEERKARPWMMVYATIWMIFFIWAVVLAMQVNQGHERVEHLVFAMLFSPIYVLAYYIGAFGNMNAKAGFGMCGGGYNIGNRY